MGSTAPGGLERDRGSHKARGGALSPASGSGSVSMRSAQLGQGPLCHRPWNWKHSQLAQSLGFVWGQTPCLATLHHVFRQLDVGAWTTHRTSGSNSRRRRSRSSVAGAAPRSFPAPRRACGQRILCASPLEFVQVFDARRARRLSNKASGDFRNRRTVIRAMPNPSANPQMERPAHLISQSSLICPTFNKG